MESHDTGCHGVYQKVFTAFASQRIYENQSIEKIRELISFAHEIISLFTEIAEPEIPAIKCSNCGHDLKFMFFVKPEPRAKPG